MGTLGMPDIFNEVMKAKDTALINALPIICEIWEEWEHLFGRTYAPVCPYRTEDAEVLLITMGSLSETAEAAIDILRDHHHVPAGLLKLMLWRPFPRKEFTAATQGARVLAVMDRAVSFGGVSGPVGAEVRACFYGAPSPPVIVNEIIGLGGRDVTVEDFISIIEKARAMNTQPPEGYEIYGVRGSS
jgi:pyruvate ferredoxin oxidoreductase alpha subunit